MATSVAFDVYAKDRASKTFTTVGASATKSEGHLSSFKKTLISVGAGFAALEVAKKAAGFLVDSTKAAMTDQAAQKSLALALGNTTNANKEQIAGVNDWLSAQSEALGFSKAELQPAFQKLAQSTGSVTKAQKELKLAMDVSAGTGRDLASVSLALTKANNGSVTGLSRLGIATKVATKNTAAISAAQISAQTAQLAYNKALTQYGQHSAEAKIAGEKLGLAQQKLGVAQKAATSTTMTLNQALKSMSDTFGGQAEARTQTLAGTMGRLKATFHEFEIEVGDKLIPVLTQFGNWLLSKGLPAAEQFGGVVDKKLGPALVMLGRALKQDAPEVNKFVDAVQKASPSVSKLAGNILTLGHHSDSKGTPALLRLGNTIQNKLVYDRLASAIQGLGDLSKAVDWVGGHLTAAAHKVADFSNAFDRAEPKIETAVKKIPDDIKTALGNLGSLLVNAGKQVVQGLINGMQSMAGALKAKSESLATKYVSNPFKAALGILSPSKIFIGHGVNIMEGLIKGIESKQVSLQTVLSKVTSAVQAAGSKLQAAIQNRNSFAAGFQSFSTSVFGADYGTDANGNPVKPTTQSILAYQRAQAKQAHMVKRDTKKLIKMGLSPALLKQLQSEGAAGIQEIQALSSASPAEIRRLNRLNKQTSSDLRSAGMAAGNRLFGDEIKQDKQHYTREEDLLQKIHDLLKREHEHGRVVGELKLSGHELIATLKKEERRTGAHA